MKWEPQQYLKFEKERTQPAIDLVNRVERENTGRIVDIGCGPGNSTAVLQRRWPEAEIVGVDASAEMLQKAAAQNPSVAWRQADASEGLKGLGQFDLVFSNAAIQWMPQHKRLFKNGFGLLRAGGTLAFQVPYSKKIPLNTVAVGLSQAPPWARHFPAQPPWPQYHDFRYFYSLLRPYTPRLQLWKTEYIHILDSHEALFEWYNGTGLQPFLDKIPTQKERNGFCEAYKAGLAKAYGPEEDGRVLLPFTRVFCLAER